MAPPVKRILDPRRVRTIPAGFSWIDRRFLRDGWIDKLERHEILLYFFLVAVADQHGLSYYSDPRVCGLLKITRTVLDQARDRLVGLGLLAFEAPIYQVLTLDPPPPRTGGMISIRDVLRQIVHNCREP